MTKFPPNDILESSYKLRIRESDQLINVFELCKLEIIKRKRSLTIRDLKTMVKRSFEQNLRSRNFEARKWRIESQAEV